MPSMQQQRYEQDGKVLGAAVLICVTMTLAVILMFSTFASIFFTVGTSDLSECTVVSAEVNAYVDGKIDGAAVASHVTTEDAKKLWRGEVHVSYERTISKLAYLQGERPGVVYRRGQKFNTHEKPEQEFVDGYTVGDVHTCRCSKHGDVCTFGPAVWRPWQTVLIVCSLVFAIGGVVVGGMDTSTIPRDFRIEVCGTAAEDATSTECLLGNFCYIVAAFSVAAMMIGLSAKPLKTDLLCTVIDNASVREQVPGKSCTDGMGLPAFTAQFTPVDSKPDPSMTIVVAEEEGECVKLTHDDVFLHSYRVNMTYPCTCTSWSPANKTTTPSYTGFCAVWDSVWDDYSTTSYATIAFLPAAFVPTLLIIWFYVVGDDPNKISFCCYLCDEVMGERDWVEESSATLASIASLEKIQADHAKRRKERAAKLQSEVQSERRSENRSKKRSKKRSTRSWSTSGSDTNTGGGSESGSETSSESESSTTTNKESGQSQHSTVTFSSEKSASADNSSTSSGSS